MAHSARILAVNHVALICSIRPCICERALHGLRAAARLYGACGGRLLRTSALVVSPLLWIWIWLLAPVTRHK